MQKVLILAYYYPPCNMPGANRPHGWAKHLSENDYYPIIITRSWENEIRSPKNILQNSGHEVKHDVFPTHEVYYVPFKQSLRDKIYIKYGDEKHVFFRKILSFYELFFSNFFSSVSSFKSIYYFSKKILIKDSEIKLLITTTEPYQLFKFSYSLCKKYNLKWIADYRDDWSTSEIDNNKNWLLKRLERIFEKKWVESAMVHTAVSPYSVEKNSMFLNKKGFTIHNGYMDENVKLNGTNTLFEKFTITFVGTLYPSQNVELFLSAFKEFLNQNKENKDIHLSFPGLAFTPSQSKRVSGFLQGFEDFYSITERIPKTEIIEIEQKTHVFLYSAHKMRGIIGSKIYEYVGLKKPVILCPSDRETIEQIFTETGIGYICNSSKEALNAINKLYNQYKSENYAFNFTENQLKMIDFYSRRSQTKVLADILDEINSTK